MSHAEHVVPCLSTYMSIMTIDAMQPWHVCELLHECIMVVSWTCVCWIVISDAQMCDVMLYRGINEQRQDGGYGTPCSTCETDGCE